MCSTFSGVRFLPDGPPPVRDAYNIFGLPGNSKQQQAEADRGTEMAHRTITISEAVLENASIREVEGIATIEQPAPRPDKPRNPSMWYLPRMKSWMERWAAKICKYTACSDGSMHYKPQLWVGVLQELKTMDRSCRCPPDFKHVPCRGREVTKKAAEYTPELCDTYAKLVLDAWERVAWTEWQAICELGRKECCGQFLFPLSDFCHKCGK